MVENPVTLAIQYAEGAAQSAIQYFENMRNFLKAVEDMQLLTFGASDLEKVFVTSTFVLGLVHFVTCFRI